MDKLHKKKMFNDYKFKEINYCQWLKIVKRIFITDLFKKMNLRSFGKILNAFQMQITTKEMISLFQTALETVIKKYREK